VQYGMDWARLDNCLVCLLVGSWYGGAMWLRRSSFLIQEYAFGAQIYAKREEENSEGA